MSDEKKAKLGLTECFWSAVSFELALRGMHPDMDATARELVAMRYGRRSLLWMPFDVGLRMATLRMADRLKDAGILTAAEVEETDDAL